MSSDSDSCETIRLVFVVNARGSAAGILDTVGGDGNVRVDASR
jgi:hypothetical protein